MQMRIRLSNKGKLCNNKHILTGTTCNINGYLYIAIFVHNTSQCIRARQVDMR